ncbi:dihydrodipicolinate synthase family protein [Chimaeribacter coloradensis]|uniref:dihydrodipicolinate synthase family protein n=1 Tax=Chimaeribacter coloradensis TaxID=2060068 RepID=UPI0019D419D2|nr:dihydrodipicolinate synthase family protein [Chimaeribacter coloradensis]
MNAGAPANGSDAYNADGGIDRHHFAAVLESLIEAGVHGIIIGSSTGEYYSQTAQERIPPNPLAWMGINSVICWQEYCAGRGG